jgi:hypothetical protein
MTDPMVTVWEGNEISDYLVHRGGGTDHEKQKFAQVHLIFVGHHSMVLYFVSSFRHLEF